MIAIGRPTPATSPFRRLWLRLRERWPAGSKDDRARPPAMAACRRRRLAVVSSIPFTGPGRRLPLHGGSPYWALSSRPSPRGRAHRLTRWSRSRASPSGFRGGRTGVLGASHRARVVHAVEDVEPFDRAGPETFWACRGKRVRASNGDARPGASFAGWPVHSGPASGSRAHITRDLRSGRCGSAPAHAAHLPGPLMRAFNPRMRVLDLVAEPLFGCTASCEPQLRGAEQVAELSRTSWVLPHRHARLLPATLLGRPAPTHRDRPARLRFRPNFIVADEPVSALDVKRAGAQSCNSGCRTCSAELGLHLPLHRADLSVALQAHLRTASRHVCSDVSSQVWPTAATYATRSTPTPKRLSAFRWCRCPTR